VSVDADRVERMFEDVVRLRGQLTELVTAVDPDALSGRTARELWAEFDRVERLAAGAKTVLARRVAATHRPDRAGTKTAADDLARRGGTSTNTARDALEISSRLAELPRLDEALRRGELSSAQASAISSAAALDPIAELRLVERAQRMSLRELREECARVRAAADPDPDATNRRIHQGRGLRRWTDQEGGWNLSARGTPQDGAAFSAVLDPIIDEIFSTARRDGRQEPVDAYGFDALIAMANRAHGGIDQPGEVRDESIRTAGHNELTGDDRSGTGGPKPGRRVGHRSVNPRYQALLRIDVQALRRGRVEGAELCEIAGVGPVPVAVARDMLGDAVLRLVVTNGVDVANVTHLGRGPTAAQRAALMWMSPTCSVEGCNRARIEIDHSEPWARTRHTRLAELNPLCGFHHGLKTRLDYALVAGSGKRPFVPPDDARHPRYRKARGDPLPAPPQRQSRKPPPGAAPRRRWPEQLAVLDS
jgi:hypothetical protein